MVSNTVRTPYKKLSATAAAAVALLLTFAPAAAANGASTSGFGGNCIVQNYQPALDITRGPINYDGYATLACNQRQVWLVRLRMWFDISSDSGASWHTQQMADTGWNFGVNWGGGGYGGGYGQTLTMYDDVFPGPRILIRTRVIAEAYTKQGVYEIGGNVSPINRTG